MTYTLASDWSDGGDGWWYYKGLLGAAGATGNSDIKDIFAILPAIPSSPGPNYEYSNAEIYIEFAVEFVAATKWETVPATTTHYAYREAWFGGSVPGGVFLPTIDSALAGLVDGSY
jgi:hypothetical protein